jgi:hypothetical protein
MKLTKRLGSLALLAFVASVTTGCAHTQPPMAAPFGGGGS